MDETNHPMLRAVCYEKAWFPRKAPKLIRQEGGQPHLSVNPLVAIKKPKTGDRIAAISRLVPGAGLEPARPFGSTDFKSVVSTNSTIQA